MRRSALVLAILVLAAPAAAQDVIPAVLPPITVEAINTAELATIPAQYVPPLKTDETTTALPERQPDPAVVRLQVLLDHAG